jgi:hypothetical protein
MANVKISELTSATTPLAGTEAVPIVQGGVTKQVTTQDIADLGGGGGGLKGINSIIKLSSGDIVSTNISTSASYFNVALVANRLYTIPFIPNEEIVTY